jgi:heme A synthase
VAALAGVSLQGVVGGLRVLEHARWGLELRILHGCFAQVVLALLVSAAVFAGRGWLAPREALVRGEGGRRLRRWSLAALGLVYLQIVLGVLLRHTYHPLWQRLHLLTAFAATAAVVWLVKTVLDTRAGGKSLRRAAAVLAGLVGLQLILGVEAWMTQLAGGALPEMLPLTVQRVAVRTAHVLGGSLVFAMTVVIALLARRPQTAGVAPAVTPDERLEEAA